MTDQSPLPEMPCQDIVEVVTLYLEDALSPLDRQRFEAHMAICAKCVDYLDQVRTTIELTGSTRLAEALPADLRTDLRSAFRDWRASA